MGIPSYFKHIILNHRSIIKELNVLTLSDTIKNLYLDSNSIIYDVVHSLDSKTDSLVPDSLVPDSLVIQRVIDKIIYYIKLVEPTGRIIVAFDGVAPMAKIKQQRNRRYLSSIQNTILNIQNKWDTAAITPGTEFMENLSNTIEDRFKYSMSEFNVEFLKISSPRECGEGEHKIYKYIRDNAQYHNDTTTVIYGLDADLIMLSLTHLRLTRQIFLFRDTPHFISGMDNTLDPKKNYLMDIRELSGQVGFEMTGSYDYDSNENKINKEANILTDYIFICFFLGNDFMPHFPALNIRTGGIHKLIQAYRHVVSRDIYLCSKTDTGRINVNWKVLRKLVEHLSLKEFEYISEEYKTRDKNELYLKTHIKNNNNLTSDKEYKLSNIPKQNREVEKYINLRECGWEKRYYKTLFDIDIDDFRQREICVHYLEGLEWNINYYMNGCMNWKWYYPYDYPPLLKDLFKYIPVFDTKLVDARIEEPLPPLVQLSYVIPQSSLYLLPEKIRGIVKQECYDETDYHRIVWAFCSYFWESHVKLNHIDIERLTQLCVKQY